MLSEDGSAGFRISDSYGEFSKLYDIDVPKCCLYNVINKSDIYKKASVGGIITKSVFTITAIGSLLEVKGFDR